MNLEDIRSELIDLFENDDWRITNKAERDGKEILSLVTGFASQFAIVEFVTDCLKQSEPMHEIQRGEPPGSRSVGYVMNVCKRGMDDLYIELVIEDDLAWIISFHISKHSKRKRETRQNE
ncbi:MAG: hypothetical protein L0215_12875 [Gemmataceae bacterium]|nr:hypothetical protein [Gemmataceae bacterium]